MARTSLTHTLALKRDPRPSLRHAGIPDGRDILTVYFWWVRQQYYRAAEQDMDLSAEVASSVMSVLGTDDFYEREPPSPTMPQIEATDGYAMENLLSGIGGQFD